MTLEDLLRIIELCRVVEAQGVDPFEVDVKKSLLTLKKYLPGLKLIDELLLDAEALNRLASIIRLQRDWVAYRASSLYIDPLVVELKIRISSPEDMARALVKSWHPIASLGQISPKKLTDAFDYWNTLLPLSERFTTPPEGVMLEPGEFDLEDLVKLKAVSEEEFQSFLQSLFVELQSKVGPEGRIRYDEFVYVEDFKETVLRAYLTSFLVSEGLAYLHVNPLEDEAHLIPRVPGEPPSTKPSSSKIVAIDHTSWRSYLDRRRG